MPQQPNVPPMPPGMRAALLDRNSSNSGPEAVNVGQVPVVGANDMKIDATQNEVILTFRVVSGGGSTDSPPQIQETARLSFTWQFAEAMFGTLGNLLEQALPMRTQAAEQIAQGLRQRLEAQGPPPPED